MEMASTGNAVPAAADVLPAWRPGTRLFVLITRAWAIDPAGGLEVGG